jgi:HAD superfamily hydrolase (TIGR01509 family)
MITAIMFDLDGTLVDTELLAAEIVGELFHKEFAIELTDIELNSIIGARWQEGLSVLLDQKGISNENFMSFINRVTETYTDALRKGFTEIPGASDLVKRLSKEYRIALVSGSSLEMITIILENLGIKDYFEIIISSEMVKEGKPSPEGFLLAAKKMRLAPADCVVFEDSERGIDAAHRAGMKCIGIKCSTFGLQDVSKADRIVRCLDSVDSAALRNI